MSQNILPNDSQHSYNQSETYYDGSMGRNSNNNSKLLRGIIIGGVVGGMVAMLDSTTRNKIKYTAMNVKDTSMDMISEVKNNPGEVKDQMVNSFKEASNVLKEAIADAQNLYERLNNDMFGKMGDVKELTSNAMDTAMEAKEGIKNIGSKVKEAGSTMMENPVAQTAGANSSSSSSAASSYATGSTTTNASSGFGSAASGNAGLGMTNGQGADRVTDTPNSYTTGNTKSVSPKNKKHNR
ncbi:YtxH domain-containing protein [Bacillus massilinigeriensis]|uniref:YtxH domain-containing protein n=1 Tax=Bacillus mediterraneensis TaxID=1805474 RepID=UPI0008F7EB1A|nr:YtxH domain-containing protein [Bacillus mediterraneensis]